MTDHTTQPDVDVDDSEDTWLVCISPACQGDFMGCNHAVSPKKAMEYAKRYAWLRERHQALCTMQAAQAIGLDLSKTFVQSPEQLDDAIDAAMNGQQS